MVPTAALILTDDSGARFDGVMLNERAALAAHDAGVSVVTFTGRVQPDLTMLRRLRSRGIAAVNQLGWPRLFASVPAAHLLVIVDARTIIEPGVIEGAIAAAAWSRESAVMAVSLGPRRKNSLIGVAAGRVRSVMGDGNAMSAGVTVVPEPLLARLRGVRSMRDAVHRLASSDSLRALPCEPFFCAPIGIGTDLVALEREYRAHRRRAAYAALKRRLCHWPWLSRPGVVAPSLP